MAKPKFEDRFFTKEEVKQLTLEQKLSIILGYYEYPIGKWCSVQFNEPQAQAMKNKITKEWLVSKARFIQLTNFINLLSEENPNSKLLANLRIQYKHTAKILVEQYGPALIYVDNPAKMPKSQPQTTFI